MIVIISIITISIIVIMFIYFWGAMCAAFQGRDEVSNVKVPKRQNAKTKNEVTHKMSFHGVRMLFLWRGGTSSGEGLGGETQSEKWEPQNLFSGVGCPKIGGPSFGKAQDMSWNEAFWAEEPKIVALGKTRGARGECCTKLEAQKGQKRM